VLGENKNGYFLSQSSQRTQRIDKTISCFLCVLDDTPQPLNRANRFDTSISDVPFKMGVFLTEMSRLKTA
jgi:hypothetical protein